MDDARAGTGPPDEDRGESSVIITARACLVPLRPYWRRPLASLLSRWFDPAGCWGWSDRGFDGWMARCRATQASLGTTRGAAMGFRRTGRGSHRRQNRTKSAADPRRCQPLGRQRPLPRQPQVADEPAGEAKLAVGRCHGPGEPVSLLRGAGPGQGPVQGLLPKADGVLDGLITSD